jgi:hypothetical protein
MPQLSMIINDIISLENHLDSPRSIFRDKSWFFASPDGLFFASQAL